MASSSAPKQKQLGDGGETDHGIPVNERRAQIISDIQALFGSKPTLENIKRNWKDDATFDDPICIASGKREFSAQWWGMPAAFPESVTEAWLVTKNEDRVLEFEQRQKYTVAGIRTSKVMRSLVHVELDENDMITHLEDRWDGKLMPTGSIANALRRFNGRNMPRMISVPKI